MPSNARLAFNESTKDVQRLLKIHSDLGGVRRGGRHQLEVLNKSAIVLITAIWEAYCEDIASEGLNNIVRHAPDAIRLPKKLKKQIASELKADANEIAIWDLADNGWRTTLSSRLAKLTVDRNRKLNTPKSVNIIQLFHDALGITDITQKWHWEGMNVVQAKNKLDKYVELRGSIAHRGHASTSCKKWQVEEYFSHISKLVAKTGSLVNAHVREITGKPLW